MVGTLGWLGVGLPVTLKAAVFFFFLLLRSLLFRLANPLGPMKTGLKEEERGRERERERNAAANFLKSKKVRGSAVL